MSSPPSPTWSLSEVFAAATLAHPLHPDSVPSYARLCRERRLSMVRVWAALVGRDRAVRELTTFRSGFRSRAAAARALRISSNTLKKLSSEFESLQPVRGLTLTFNTHLHRFDPAAFDLLITDLLGADTDVTIEARSKISAPGPGWIRLDGSSASDLLTVVEAFYDRVWMQAVDVQQETLTRALASGVATILARLEHQRESLIRIEESVGILKDPGVCEMFADQSRKHVQQKDKRLLQTRFQRVAGGLAHEVQRRTVGSLGKVLQGELEDGAGSLIAADGDE